MSLNKGSIEGLNEREMLTYFRKNKKSFQNKDIVGSCIVYNPNTDKANKDNNKVSEQAYKCVLLKNRNNPDLYIRLLSTDISLSDEDIIKIYSMRWGIEQTFKDCKSHLGLKGFSMSRKFESTIAQVTLSFIRYTILSYMRRTETDVRSIGEIFADVDSALYTYTYEEAIEILSTSFVNCIEDMIEKGMTPKNQAEKARDKLKNELHNSLVSISKFISRFTELISTNTFWTKFLRPKI